MLVTFPFKNISISHKFLIVCFWIFIKVTDIASCFNDINYTISFIELWSAKINKQSNINIIKISYDVNEYKLDRSVLSAF